MLNPLNLPHKPFKTSCHYDKKGYPYPNEKEVVKEANVNRIITEK
ncbi:MAG: hypothetical protein QM669_09755 [Siphonobacter sp.]